MIGPYFQRWVASLVGVVRFVRAVIAGPPWGVPPAFQLQAGQRSQLLERNLARLKRAQQTELWQQLALLKGTVLSGVVTFAAAGGANDLLIRFPFWAWVAHYQFAATIIADAAVFAVSVYVGSGASVGGILQTRNVFDWLNEEDQGRPFDELFVAYRRFMRGLTNRVFWSQFWLPELALLSTFVVAIGPGSLALANGLAGATMYFSQVCIDAYARAAGRHRDEARAIAPTAATVDIAQVELHLAEVMGHVDTLRTEVEALMQTLPAVDAAAVLKVLRDLGVATGPLRALVTRPIITSLSAAAGPLAGGEELTIIGTNLADVTEVLFGTTQALDMRGVGPGQIIVRVPPATAPGTVDVVVETPIASSPASTAARYTYEPQP
jgi:hypothetical protein